MEAIYQYLIVFITAIFVNNVVLSQILGICPFLGVSKKINTALGMSGAVAFVLVLATLVTYLLQYYVLNPLELGYLQTIAFILVIGAVGGNHPEKSIPGTLSGIGSIPSSDNH